MECVPPLSSILFRDRQDDQKLLLPSSAKQHEAQLNLCKVYSQLSHRPEFCSDKGKFTDILRSLNKFSKINTSRIPAINTINNTCKSTPSRLLLLVNLLIQDYLEEYSRITSNLLHDYFKIT